MYIPFIYHQENSPVKIRIMWTREFPPADASVICKVTVSVIRMYSKWQKTYSWLGSAKCENLGTKWLSLLFPLCRVGLIWQFHHFLWCRVTLRYEYWRNENFATSMLIYLQQICSSVQNVFLGHSWDPLSHYFEYHNHYTHWDVSLLCLFQRRSECSNVPIEFLLLGIQSACRPISTRFLCGCSWSCTVWTFQSMHSKINMVCTYGPICVQCGDPEQVLGKMYN